MWWVLLAQHLQVEVSLTWLSWSVWWIYILRLSSTKIQKYKMATLPGERNKSIVWASFNLFIENRDHIKSWFRSDYSVFYSMFCVVSRVSLSEYSTQGKTCALYSFWACSVSWVCISMFLTEGLQTHSEQWDDIIYRNLVELSLEIKILIGNKTSNQKWFA